MKSRPNTNTQPSHWRKAMTLGALLLALSPLITFAWEGTVNLTAALTQALDSTVSAHVVVGPGIFLTPTATTEQSLTALGCHYEVNDQESLAQLLDIIRQADIRADEMERSVDMRSIVELTDSRGRTTKLAFEGIGERIEGTVDRIPALAAAGYHAALLKWANGRIPTSIRPGAPCR